MGEEIFNKLSLYQRMCYKAHEIQLLINEELREHKHLFEEDKTLFAANVVYYNFISIQTGRVYSSDLMIFGVFNNFSMLNLEGYFVTPTKEWLKMKLNFFNLIGKLSITLPERNENLLESYLKFIMRHKYNKYWCLSCNNWKTIKRKQNDQSTGVTAEI